MNLRDVASSNLSSPNASIIQGCRTICCYQTTRQYGMYQGVWDTG
jgi:hypothetical protein